MQIIVGDYDNEQVNNGAVLNTVNTRLVKPGELGGLGGVDHFMCNSVRTIVSRYVSRLKRDNSYGFPGAEYNVVIELRRAYEGPVERTVTIPIRCE
ncbi:hypothetical protein LCGC14_1548450 [marine sediment metagenome]|uniref:Uncharacterized protein n=1 Tax=marine sediment metagenome TaxID=412755 RepID=A0A0F9IR22_9ZZZZ